MAMSSSAPCPWAMTKFGKVGQAKAKNPMEAESRKRYRDAEREKAKTNSVLQMKLDQQAAARAKGARESEKRWKTMFATERAKLLDHSKSQISSELASDIGLLLSDIAKVDKAAGSAAAGSAAEDDSFVEGIADDWTVIDSDTVAKKAKKIHEAEVAQYDAAKNDGEFAEQVCALALPRRSVPCSMLARCSMLAPCCA